MAINIGGEIREIIIDSPIRRAQVGADTIFIREVTQSYIQPTGGNLNWSTPPTRTDIPMATYPADTITATADSNSIISGTPNLLGLPEGITFTYSYNNVGTGNTLTITLGGVFPDNNNDDISIIVAGLGGVYPIDFLVVAAGGSGGSPGAGGLRTSWGTYSGGPEMVADLGNGGGITNNVQAPAEEPIIATGGQVLSIHSGYSRPPDVFEEDFNPAGTNTTYVGENSWITGTGVDVTSFGGANGHINSSSTFTSNRITRAGTDGGSGSGGRTYSGNLSTVSVGGGSGGVDPHDVMPAVPGHGYNGGGAQSRNASAFGGSGGAGGAGSYASFTGGNSGSAAAGLGLSNDILGSNIRYSGANDDRSGNNNPGSPSRDGAVVIRVPDSEAGTATGTTAEYSVSGDRVYVWSGNVTGTYTVYENLPPAPEMTVTNEEPNLGDSVTFTCSANDPENGNITYSWYINDGSGTTITGNPFREISNTTGSDSVTITQSAAGTHTVICIVNDGENSVLSSETLEWLKFERECELNSGFSYSATWTGDGEATITLTGDASGNPGFVMDGGNVLVRLQIGGFDMNSGNTVFPTLTASVASGGHTTSPLTGINYHILGSGVTGRLRLDLPETDTYQACTVTSGVLTF